MILTVFSCRHIWRYFLFFFSAVKGKTPQVGDRVLVEAVYNPNMPFKWNAQRIQTLPQLANQSVRTRRGYINTNKHCNCKCNDCNAACQKNKHMLWSGFINYLMVND